MRALFGEKYGDEVRVVSMGTVDRPDGDQVPYSVELCGGTHAARTGDIGLIAVVAEGAVSAGVRRIEAMTGNTARRYLNEQSRKLKGVAQALRANVDEWPSVPPPWPRSAGSSTAISRMRGASCHGGGQRPARGDREGRFHRFCRARTSGCRGEGSQGLADQEKVRLGSGVVALGVVGEDGRAGSWWASRRISRVASMRWIS